MSKKDWYRRETWNSEDREDFYAHLGRAREHNKPQYVRIQATILYNTGKREHILAALDLLDLYLRSWPDYFDLAVAYYNQAQCFVSLGKADEAIEAFQNAIEAQRKQPNVHTGAPLGFGLFIISEKRFEYYEEVIRILGEFYNPNSPLYPQQRFVSNSILSLIYDQMGQEKLARRTASLALEEAEKLRSGEFYHPELGLVNETDHGLINKLRSLRGPDSAIDSTQSTGERAESIRALDCKKPNQDKISVAHVLHGKETMDSRKVTRNIRQIVRPFLKEAGFSQFTGRQSWRYRERSINVVKFWSYIWRTGPHSTTYSFKLLLGIFYLDIPDMIPHIKVRNGFLLPGEESCQLRREMLKPIIQEEEPGENIWYVAEDGSNLDEIILASKSIIEDDGLAWFDKYSDPEAFYDILQSNTEFDPNIGWGFGFGIDAPVRMNFLGCLSKARGDYEGALEYFHRYLDYLENTHNKFGGQNHSIGEIKGEISEIENRLSGE